KTVNRNFSDESNPNSRSYKGDRSFVEAISISDSDNVMNAEIGVDLKSNRTYSPTNEITSTTEKQRVDNFINPYLLYFLFQKEKKDDKESENISHECLPQLKEKTGLNFYGKGYQWGYLQGYSEVLKFYKKFKK
ncbi:MAG: hypothetical protein ACXVHW_05380, partial [Methanobacterium sp.]